MAVKNSVIVKEEPAHEHRTITATYIVRRCGTTGKGAKAVSVDETETFPVSIETDDNARPVHKKDHLAAARLYSAMKAHRAELLADEYAEYRSQCAEWRKVVDAIATGERSSSVPPKPVKPELSPEVAQTIARIDEWCKAAVRAWSGCRKYTIRCGSWYGTLSSVVQNKPNAAKMAAGAK